MKIKKKTAMLLSFAVGTVMFTTTAFAEITSKSGYEQSKDVLKYTADQLSEKLSSYTADVTLIIKDNNSIISTYNTVNKYDVTKNSCENISTTNRNGKKEEDIYYRDKNTIVSYNKEQGIYYVTEYKNSLNYTNFNNPFKGKQAGDIEKIADALIGQLKDNVVVSQNADGSKELSGSISEAQIPTLVNAVVSFQFKNSFSMNRNQDEENEMPKVTKDIFVKNVNGKMTVDKNGLMQSGFGTGILCGKDDKGQEHQLTFELLGKLYDINSTKVNIPDLSGKKVEKNVVDNSENGFKPEMYLGKYKNDIIIEKDGKYEKIGEAIIVISNIDKKNISGTYTEEYKKKYEEYAKDKREIKFDGTFGENSTHASFSFITEDGKKQNGNVDINDYNAKVYFYINGSRNMNIRSDNEFSKVFD